LVCAAATVMEENGIRPIDAPVHMTFNLPHDGCKPGKDHRIAIVFAQTTATLQ
jgi:hypothetical protein